MSRIRCANCICNYDGENERPGVPSKMEIYAMSANTLDQTLQTLGINYGCTGIQQPTLGGNMDRVCQSTRNSFVNQIIQHRITLQLLKTNESTEGSEG